MYKLIGYYQDGEYTKSFLDIDFDKISFEIYVNKNKEYKVIKVPPYWKVNILTRSEMYFPSLEEAMMYVSMQE